MSIALHTRRESERPLAIPEAEVASLVEAVLAAEGFDLPVELSLTVADEREMQALNLELRGVDAPTDVLSVELERPDDPDLAPGEPCMLGDLVLCPAVIERQAADFATTPADETRLLVIHGTLHLLGYDHEDEAAAMAMETVQAPLVAKATEGRVQRVALGPHEAGEPS